MAFGDNWQCARWQMEVAGAEHGFRTLSPDAVGKGHTEERTPLPTTVDAPCQVLTPDSGMW